MSDKESVNYRCNGKKQKMSENNDPQCCHQRCKTCKCPNSEKRSTDQKLHFLMISEPQTNASESSTLEGSISCGASLLDPLPDYHNLLPRYLQDALKRAARSYPDHPFSRLCEIEHVMQMVKSEFPKGFKYEDAAQQ